MSESPPELSAVRNGNRAACPVSNPDNSMGLTKREEIAARVLAGLASNAHEKAWDMDYREWAVSSIKAADALLLELEQRPFNTK